MNCTFNPEQRRTSFESLWQVAAASGCSHITIVNGDVGKIGQFRKDPFRLLAYCSERCGRPKTSITSCHKAGPCHLIMLASANPFSRIAAREVRKIIWSASSLTPEYLKFKSSGGAPLETVEGPSLTLRVLPRSARRSAPNTYEDEADYFNHQGVAVELRSSAIQIYAKCEVKAIVSAPLSERSEMTQNLSKIMDITVPTSESRNNVTIVDCDLKGYSDVARYLEESQGAGQVLNFNNEIQKFVSLALDQTGILRADAVLAETGDGAILSFNKADDAEKFCVCLHLAAQQHNESVTAAMLKRSFRTGAASGNLAVMHDAGVKKFGGLAVSNAVRLQTAASVGTVMITEEVYRSLSPDRKVGYVRSTVSGKREERFTVYTKRVYDDRSGEQNVGPAAVPIPKARGLSKERSEILKAALKLSEGDVDRVFWIVEIDPSEWPSHQLALKDRTNKLLEWAGNDPERLASLADAIAIVP